MCVNKDLLDKEGIAVPKEGWTLKSSTWFAKKLTKDTNGDGQLDQFGSTEYTWKEALAANGGHLFQGGMLKLTAPGSKSLWLFCKRLEDLKYNKVSSKDFDQGKVAFYPMTLAQYRTYKPYPYHVSNIQTSPGPVSRCLLSQNDQGNPWSRRLLLLCQLEVLIPSWAWELMQLLTEDPEIQQTLFCPIPGDLCHATGRQESL